MTGMTFQTDPHLPSGKTVLMRGIMPVVIGAIAETAPHYRQGDVLLISLDTEHEIRAALAKDVTPSK